VTNLDDRWHLLGTVADGKVKKTYIDGKLTAVEFFPSALTPEQVTQQAKTR
jgi:hypothetical protein